MKLITNDDICKAWGTRNLTQVREWLVANVKPAMERQFGRGTMRFYDPSVVELRSRYLASIKPPQTDAERRANLAKGRLAQQVARKELERTVAALTARVAGLERYLGIDQPQAPGNGQYTDKLNAAPTTF